MTDIAIAPDEARALAAVGRRQLSWDARMPARIVTTPRALGVYTTPPLDVLVFTAVPADVAGEPLDRVISLASLVTELERAASGEGRVFLGTPEEVRVPVTAAVNVAELPPADGWQVPMQAVAGDLAAKVDAAVAEFDRRAKGAPSEAERQRIAEEIWGAVAWAGIPMRTLHAARKLGMLGTDSVKVSAATCGQWRRLSTRRGEVFSRGIARMPLRVAR